jgi:YVTN family beta-propeller protein
MTNPAILGRGQGVGVDWGCHALVVASIEEDCCHMLFNGRLFGRPIPWVLVRGGMLMVAAVGGLLVAPGLSVDAATAPMATIAVGLDPYDVVVDPANGLVYVTNQQADTVSAIDAATNQVVGTMAVGADPTYMGVNAINGNVYVANNNAADVSVINGATNQVVNTIPVSDAPSGVAINPVNGTVYVSEWSSGTVAVIDAATNPVVQTITVGGQPFTPIFDAANGDVYVPSWSTNAVYVINGATNQVVQTIPVGSGPNFAAVDAANGDVYIANWESDTVSVIDGATNQAVDTIAVGIHPRAVAVNPVNGNLYVANNGSDTVSVINGTTNQVVQTLNAGISPAGIAADPANGNVYIVDSGSNAVSVLLAPSAPWMPPKLIPEPVTVGSISGAVIGNLGFNPITAVQNGTYAGYMEERAALVAGVSFTGEGTDSSYLSAILDGAGVGQQQHVSATQQGEFAALYQKLGIIPTWTDNSVGIAQGVAALENAKAPVLAIENYLVQLGGYSWTVAQQQAALGFPIAHS